MRRPIAADYDGTYDDHPEIWGQVDVIITGNPWQSYDEVMSDWSGPKKPVFWNPQVPDGDVLTIVSHKASVINQLKVRKYFEDQEEQASMLRLLCPDTDIILVEPENTYL